VAVISGHRLRYCQLAIPAIGVLKNENGEKILPAVSAWKIDEKQMKFVELKTEGLRCSRDGIVTADGGL